MLILQATAETLYIGAFKGVHLHDNNLQPVTTNNDRSEFIDNTFDFGLVLNTDLSKR